MSSFKQHYCELRRDKLRNRHLKPDASLKDRFVAFYFNIIRPHPDNYVIKSLFRSNYAVQQEIRRHYRSKYWYIIHPGSRFAYYKAFLLFALIIIDLMLKPAIATFTGFKPERHRIMRAISVLLDVIMLTWCISNFFCGYVSSKTGTIVLDGKKIAKKYLSTYCLFDFLASVSLNVYYFDESDNLTAMTHVARYLCLCRSIRLITLITRLKQYLEARNYVQYGLLPFLIIITAYTLHIFTLLHYYLLHELLKTELIKEGWVNSITGKGTNILKKYLMSFWVTSRIFYNTGNLLSVTHDWEYLLNCLMLTVGHVNGLIITSMLLRIFQLSGISEMKYQTMIREVEDYSHQSNLPIKLKKKLMLFYERKYKGHYLSEVNIQESLTEAIKTQMKQYECHKQMKEILILQNLPQDVIFNIWLRSKHEFYLENDVVFVAEQTLDSIYFISSGSLALFLLNGTEFERHIHDGDILGDMGYIHNKKTLYGAVAIEVTEVLRLPIEDLEKIFESCRDFKEIFLTSAAWKLKKVHATDDFIISAVDKPILDEKKLRK